MGIVLAAFILWVLPIRSGLWLDECGTFWVVREDLATTVDRAWRFQLQSPLYYIFARAAVVIGGAREASLRFPSLVCMALATLVVAAIGRRARDRETGLLAAASFVCLPDVAFAACDARPYAMSVLALAGATWAFLAWLDDPRAARGILYGALAALAVWCHYVVALPLVVHPFYALHRRRERGSPRLGPLILPGIVGLALIAPLARQLLALTGTTSFLGVPLWNQLLGVLFPKTLLPLSVALAIVWLRGWKLEVNRVALLEGTVPLAFFAAWHVVPRLIVFALAHVSPYRVFLDRYLLGAAPGFAVLLAMMLRSVEPPRTRSLLVVVMLVVSTLMGASTRHSEQDLRAVSAAVRDAGPADSTPILANFGFIESTQLERLEEPVFRSFVLAPLACYPVKGTVFPLPRWLTTANLPVYEAITRRVAEEKRVILVTQDAPIDPQRWWLEGRLGCSGFERTRSSSTGDYWIIVFERRLRRG